ncbi:hypothetical protein MVI01_31800 [Myxococcus virescens]|uniref:Uncharacterized protein n=1 Tax=Myxococcus virescens TaxID=83456 RepID=A0A511HCX6_9BACT|nr:hypothetical protein MVI01_31800 [Myxococcus virescens]
MTHGLCAGPDAPWSTHRPERCYVLEPRARRPGGVASNHATARNTATALAGCLTYAAGSRRERRPTNESGPLSSTMTLRVSIGPRT